MAFVIFVISWILIGGVSSNFGLGFVLAGILTVLYRQHLKLTARQLEEPQLDGI